MVSTSETNIQRITEELGRKYKTLFCLEVQRQLVSEAFIDHCFNAVARVFIAMQAMYFGENSQVAAEDPTSLMPHYVGAIREEIRHQLQVSAASVNPQTGTFTLTLLSDDFLGIGEELGQNPPPIQWASLFLMGAFEANLIWVSNETAAQLAAVRPNKELEVTNLGRFGMGHLWRGGNLDALTRWFKAAGLNITEHIHPQSGKVGNPAWFAGVSQSLDLQTYVYEPAQAVTAAKIYA